MTPERLEVIRELADGTCQAPNERDPDMCCNVCDPARFHRAELLAYVDELRAQVRAGQQSIARESHRQTVQAHNAAHLLAHQQARGIRLRRLGAIAAVGAADQVDALIANLEQAEMDVRDGVRLIRDLTAERDTLRAENERLRMLLQRTHEAWSWEANQGDGIDERNGEVWETVRYALTGICNHGREDMSRCRTCETALTPEAK